MLYNKKAHAEIAQLIERCLAKAEVAGLSPVSRSIIANLAICGQELMVNNE